MFYIQFTINILVKAELIKMTQALDKETSDSLTEMETMTYRTHGGRSIHCSTRTVDRASCVRKVMGSIPVRELRNLFVPRSCHVDQFTFHILLPSLKFTIFIHLSSILVFVVLSHRLCLRDSIFPARKIVSPQWKSKSS